MPEKCPHCPARASQWACPRYGRGHRRYCDLCHPDHPDHAAWRRIVFDLAERDRLDPAIDRTPPAPPPTPPPPAWSPAPPGAIALGLASPCLALGGAERWMLDLLAGLDSRIHRVGVAVHSDLYRDDRFVDAARHHAPVHTGPTAIASLARHCDILLVWGVHELRGILPPPGSRQAKVVLASHGSGPWTAEVFATAGSLDAYVAVSRIALTIMTDDQRRNATVIYNGIDEDRVRATQKRDEVRAAWGIPPGRRVVGQIGRLSPEKYPEAIIHAAAELERREPGRWAYVHIGDGWKGDQIRQWAREVVGDAVTFVGTTYDLGNVYNAMDTLLLASGEEACPYVCLEAWLAGVPVVAAPTGLVPEYPDLFRVIPFWAAGGPLTDALIADRDDVAGTVARIERAREIARREFSMERFNRRWSDYLAGLVPIRSRPAKPRVTIDQLAVQKRGRATAATGR